jgi:hypothetical protein
MTSPNGDDEHPGADGTGTFSRRSSRILFGRILGVLGLAIYNWWIVVAANSHLLTSSDEFFSDLEAFGRPNANLLQRLDLVAGLTLLSALLLRGPSSRRGPRPEWRWLVGFSAAGALGGQFAYACSEGLSAVCRRAEWHLHLPFHHYVHVLSGVTEFAAITIAIYLARQRTKGQGTLVARAIKWIAVTLLVAYPLLGVSYVSDRYGAFVEPVFFVCFSVVVAMELFEPAGPT